MVKFKIDIQTDTIIIAFRKYKSFKHGHGHTQSIIIWWIFGSTVFKSTTDYDSLKYYDFKDILEKPIGAIKK